MQGSFKAFFLENACLFKWLIQLSFVNEFGLCHYSCKIRICLFSKAPSSAITSRISVARSTVWSCEVTKLTSMSCVCELLVTFFP